VAKGLHPGQRYGAWMPPKDGRYVWVEFAADAGTVRLPRQAGDRVSGGVSGAPEGASPVKVSVSDALGREVKGIKLDAEGRWEVRGLPPGRWTVKAACELRDGTDFEAKGSIDTGGTLDLKLAPRKKVALRAENSSDEER
jgi:hypothetical protein